MTATHDRSADASGVVIRTLHGQEEFDACVHLQQSVWQFPDIDVIPRRMFAVAQAVGGQVFGAWDGEKLAGYALAIPGVRDGKPFLHSHMLAVLPEYRNRGIGVKLKFAQREDALARGIDRIEWTFDPMQVKNAYLNIEKLGAVARRYSIDFYGKSKSPLHGYLPTDRLHAEWWLRSERVLSLMQGREMPAFPIHDTIAVTYNARGPGGTLHASQATAIESLLQVREKFRAAFANNLTLLKVEIDSGNAARYLLGHFEE
ncbi:MAG: GNAT family N-acetyltransferase [Acidobacteriaceae bacterium]